MGHGPVSSSRVKVSFPSLAVASVILQRLASAICAAAVRVAELASPGALNPSRITAAMVYWPVAPGCTGSPSRLMSDGGSGAGVAGAGVAGAGGCEAAFWAAASAPLRRFSPQSGRSGWN